MMALLALLSVLSVVIIIIIIIITLAAGAAADKAAANKEIKYSALASTHIFFPIAFETSGVMNRLAVDLISEIGRRISSVTEDTRETMFLFQRLSGSLLSSHFCQLRNVIAVAVVLCLIFYTFGNRVLRV